MKSYWSHTPLQQPSLVLGRHKDVLLQQVYPPDANQHTNCPAGHGWLTDTHWPF